MKSFVFEDTSQAPQPALPVYNERYTSVRIFKYCHFGNHLSSSLYLSQRFMLTKLLHKTDPTNSTPPHTFIHSCDGIRAHCARVRVSSPTEWGLSPLKYVAYLEMFVHKSRTNGTTWSLESNFDQQLTFEYFTLIF